MHLEVHLRLDEHGWNWNKTKQLLLFRQTGASANNWPFLQGCQAEKKQDSFVFVDPVSACWLRIKASISQRMDTEYITQLVL